MRETQPPTSGSIAGAMRGSRTQPELFSEVFRSCAQRVLGNLVSMTRDAELAAELTAETFAVAFEKRARFRGHSDGELFGWLNAIARNKFVDSLKRGQVERTAIESLGLHVPQISDSDAADLEFEHASAEARAALVRELERLPRRQRDAIVMRVIHELSYDEIADATATSVAASRQHVSRGLSAMRGRLKEIDTKVVEENE